ncbi:amidohydrolase family protein [Pelagibacterium limicola]|uniref:amidohydrolase family protein n=1 Tax=Pelagibacterium limicola TaxID=2791022 RepID=UPI0018AFA3F1|nr:amidohydrolase family protein [Pelagibacterium limicola]
MTPHTGPLVDSHFHVYTRDMPLLGSAWHRPGHDATIEMCLETLDAHGVVFGVISAASLYGTYNDYVRKALKAHSRLRATAIIDTAWDIYQLERMRDDGFVGLRLLWRPLAEIPDINSDAYRRLLRRCADLGWHIHLTDKPERLDATVRAIEDAGVNVVLDHIGLIDTAQGVNDPAFRAILAAIDRGRTWVKLSGGYRFTTQGLADSCAAALVNAGGWDRLVWASDWPFAAFEEKVTYADTIADLSRWVPNPDMRHAVGARTPLKLYFT